MRKELIAAFVAASALYGCGYDDGKEIVEIKEKIDLPATCAYDRQCSANGLQLGVCEDFACRRFCNTQNDCGNNELCDGDICRPIIDCPNLTFTKPSASDNAQYASSRKCIKIFSHTPSANWAKLLTGDVVLSNDNLNNPTATGDFTSSNYTFILPREALSGGMSFSVISYVAMNYITKLLAAPTAVAQCLKPQIEDENGNWVDYTSLGLYDKLTYRANYQYIPVEDLNATTGPAICTGALKNINKDMIAYVYALALKNGIEDTGNENEEGLQIKDLIDNLEKLDKQEEEEGGDDENYKDIIANYDKVYDYLRNNKTIDPLNEYLKMVNSKPICKEAINQLDSLIAIGEILRSFSGRNESATAANGIKEYIQTSLKLDKTLISNAEIGEETLQYFQTMVIDPIPSNILPSKLKTIFRTSLGNGFSISAINKDNFTYAAMQSQLNTCFYIMAGFTGNNALAMFQKSGDLKINSCATAPHLGEALISLEQVKTLAAANALLNTGDITTINAALADPTHIWFSGKSFMPFTIQLSASEKKDTDILNNADGLIIEPIYSASSHMFTDGLIGTLRISVIPEYIKQDLENRFPDKYLIQTTDNAKEKNDKLIALSEDTRIASFNYAQTDVSSDQKAGEWFYPFTPSIDNQMRCTNNQCEMNILVTPNDMLHQTFECGGFNFTVNKLNGYLMLNSSNNNAQQQESTER